MPKSTVLILGAGASKPYGLPTGFELRQKILDLENDLDKFQFFARTDKSNLRNFLNSFRFSEVESIDAYLAANKSFSRLAKIAIGLVLYGCEDPSLLFSGTDGDHWYQLLWNKIRHDDWEQFQPSWLSIVTFNYDLSLYAYLFTAIKNYYRRSDEEVFDKLSQIKILHVYGKLEADFLSYGKRNLNIPEDEFDEDDLANNFEKSVMGIKVISEGREDDQVLAEIKTIILNAQRIAFLGFGFNLENLSRINSKEAFGSIENPKEVIATTKGISPRVINEQIKLQVFNTDHGRFDSKIFFEDKTCSQLIKDHMIFD